MLFWLFCTCNPPLNLIMTSTTLPDYLKDTILILDNVNAVDVFVSMFVCLFVLNAPVKMAVRKDLWRSEGRLIPRH